MRIVYLSTAYIPSRTANSVHIMKMCSALAKNGNEVTLFAPKLKSYEQINSSVFDYYNVVNNFTIHRVLFPNFKYGIYIYAINCLFSIYRYKPKFIYSRSLLCSLFSSLARKPMLLELHYPIEKSSNFQYPGFKRFIRSKIFRNLIVITEPLKRIYLQRFLMPSNKITVLPDGADMPTFKNNAINFINDKLNVGYTGHLYKGRGINLIIELARRSKWAFFHIVGGNVDDIEKLKKNTMEIDNLKIYGFLSPKETEKIRLNMDVLLAPYQKKVMLGSGKLTTEEWMSPLKVFEYMAAGKAIIASDLPVLHEVLDNGRNCIMCPPSTTELWIEALNKLNQNQKLRENLGKTAQEDLKLKYTWDIRAKRILEVATQVL